MKISVSLPESDIAFLDAQGENRSAVLQKAVAALRRSQLDDDYAGAFAEWHGSDDQEAWDTVAADGLPR